MLVRDFAKLLPDSGLTESVSYFTAHAMPLGEYEMVPISQPSEGFVLRDSLTHCMEDDGDPTE